jgi:hypothetical protein
MEEGLTQYRCASAPDLGLAVDDVRPAANWIQRAPGESDQKAVASGSLHATHQLFIKYVFAQHPCQAADRRYDQVHLSYASQTVS